MAKRFEKVFVEISNVCNLQCDFCPEVERQKHFMKPELFETVIQSIAPLTEQVCFHLMGEPLLHPRFIDYVEFCAKTKVPVNITSNGVLLNEARAQALLNPIVRQVNFSVHSFESNFPGKDITPYLSKLFDFIKKAKAHRPDLYINFRLWNINKIRAGATVDVQTPIILEQVANEFGVRINPQQVDITRQKGVNVEGRFYINFDSRFTWPHPDQPDRATRGFCYGLQSHFGILADGTVVPCCLDKEGRLALGNCSGQNILDILENERASKIRNGFKNFQLVESLCQKCTFVERFDNKAARATALRKSCVNASNIIVGI
jgi:MoaA/NifB/PqqE/SkfB family radical SAM enzyme